MITVGFSRNDAGQPVMREKAQPTSEQIFTEMGPSMAEEMRLAGYRVMWDGVGMDDPQVRYSHSSADLK